MDYSHMYTYLLYKSFYDWSVMRHGQIEIQYALDLYLDFVKLKTY